MSSSYGLVRSILRFFSERVGRSAQVFGFVLLCGLSLVKTIEGIETKVVFSWFAAQIRRGW